MIKDNLDVRILQNKIKTAAARRYHEEKWISTLKTVALHGLNTETGDYVKKCIISTNSVTDYLISFNIMFTQ